MPNTPELKSFDRVAHIYDETRGLPPEVEAAMADAIVATLRAVSPQPRLFETGIGTGRVAVPVAARGVRVAGLDISPKMLAILREKRGDIDVVFAEGAHPPFRPRSFDGAVHFHILHLVPDAAATVRGTLDLLRPGGAYMMCIDEHVPGSLATRIDDVMEKILREETEFTKGGRQVGAELEALATGILRERGARVERPVVTRWTEMRPARDLIERTRRRDHSGAWRHTDAQIETMARRAEAELPAVVGSLDDPVGFDHEMALLVGWVR